MSLSISSSNFYPTKSSKIFQNKEVTKTTKGLSFSGSALGAGAGLATAPRVYPKAEINVPNILEPNNVETTGTVQVGMDTYDYQNTDMDLSFNTSVPIFDIPLSVNQKVSINYETLKELDSQLNTNLTTTISTALITGNTLFSIATAGLGTFLGGLLFGGIGALYTKIRNKIKGQKVRPIKYVPPKPKFLGLTGAIGSSIGAGVKGGFIGMIGGPLGIAIGVVAGFLFGLGAGYLGGWGAGKILNKLAR